MANDPDSDSDRRFEDRLDAGIPCWIGILGAQTHRAAIVDWSDNGLGLKLSEPIDYPAGKVLDLVTETGGLIRMTVAWVSGDRLGLQGDGSAAYAQALAEMAGVPYLKSSSAPSEGS
mgnify:CR=1 FL=1